MEAALNILRQLHKELENGGQVKLVEAVDVIKAETADMSARLAAAPLPESGGSANVKVVNPKTKMEFLVTFRHHNPFVLIDTLPLIERAIMAVGYVAFDEYVDMRRSQREQPGNAPRHIAPPAQAQAVPPPGLAQSPAPVHTPEPVAAGEITFPAETLKGSMTDDKPYWRVYGGKYHKHGVIIWPEVIKAAGFDPDSLQTKVDYSLSGRTAICETNDAGNPKKVIRLA